MTNSRIAQYCDQGDCGKDYEFSCKTCGGDFCQDHINSHYCGGDE